MNPGVRGYAFMLAAGPVISLFVEWMTVSMAKWWTYTEQMPIVPGLDIGIAPLVQMLVLPSLVFRIVTLWPFQTVSQRSA